MKLSNLLVSAVIAILVAGGVAWIVASPSTQSTAPVLGSLTGPDIASPYLKWGGVSTYRGNTSMKAATTTLCAIQSPVATSTLVWAAWKIDTGTSTAATIDLATSTNAYSTTTAAMVVGTSVSSNAYGYAQWESSGTNGALPPNTWVIVKTAGAGLSGYTYGGSCKAEFTVI